MYRMKHRQTESQSRASECLCAACSNQAQDFAWEFGGATDRSGWLAKRKLSQAENEISATLERALALAG